MPEDKTICPHCGQKMSKIQVPAQSTWGESYWYVCFNDECKYYIRGWDHMYKTMKVKCSYRYKYEPDTGVYGPMPVYSKDMGREAIVED